MAKCKACGETYPEGSRFCSRCGASVADDNAVIAEALQAAQKDFDRDSMATLDKSRITYVCSICGSINRIDQDKCVRCGKPRPRSEYVNALKRINASKEMNAQPETLVAPLPVQAAEPDKEVQEPAVQEPVVQPEPEVKAEPVQPVAQPVAQQVVQNVVPVGGGQAGVITQPFVVVPYVDSMYPLRQYNPNQLYRYQPYTQEELAAMKAQREAEELKARQAAQAAQGETEPPVHACDCDEKAKKVKSFGIGTLILSIVMLAVAIWKAIGLGVSGVFNDFSALGLGGVIMVVGNVVMLIMGLIGIIHSSVRIAGNCKCKGWIIGFVYLIGALAYLAGSAFYAANSVAAGVVLDYVKDSRVVNFFICCVPAIIHLIVAACSPNAEKCCECK